VDLYSISGHKICAPKGVGALYVRGGAVLEPIIRAATTSATVVREPKTSRARRRWRRPQARRGATWIPKRGAERVARPLGERHPRTRSGAGVNGGRAARIPNTTNIWFDGVQGEALVIALDLAGFAVSTGSACSSGAVEPSHVLSAMGLSADAPARACGFRWAGRTRWNKSMRWSKRSRRRWRACAAFRPVGTPMPDTQTIAVAMSGGVDSSTAARCSSAKGIR
jgi:hypothetical protein